MSYDAILLGINSMTTHIREDGTGIIYIPSRIEFERITPQTTPNGTLFLDGSFLTIKEIFRYDYPSEKPVEAQICRIEYSYHYQNPHERYYFRYDFHPEIGDPATHPLHHLHFRGWLENATSLPEVPRFAVEETTLSEVLNLIQRDFFTSS